MNTNGSYYVIELRNALNRSRELAEVDNIEAYQVSEAVDDLVDTADEVLNLLLDENGLPPTEKQREALQS